MNKILIIAAATGSAAIIAGLVTYVSRQSLEVEFQSNDKDFRLPEFVKVQDFTAEQVRDIERLVCGGVGREDWVPQRVVFAYLEPRETVYRIPCGQGPPGYFYRSFYFSGVGPSIVDEYQPNAQSLFDIASPRQAAEYVMFFDVVLSGEPGNKQFVITEDQYDRWAEQCIKDNSTSAVKELTMISSSENYVVQLNYVDNVGGSFEYRHYMVARNGTTEILAERSLGDCGFDI